MPHRIAAALAAHVKFLVGSTGLVGTGLAYLHQFAMVDPDHLKLLILAVGGGFLTLIYFSMKELIPLYVSSRKQLKQMSLDLAEMDRKSDRNAEEIEQVRVRALQEVAAAKLEVEKVKARALDEVAANKAEVEKVREESKKKRHDLAERMDGQLSKVKVDLFESQLEVKRLRDQLGLTDASHSRAINSVSDSVQEIAARLDPPLEVATPHLTPTSGSGEFDALPPPAATGPNGH